MKTITYDEWTRKYDPMNNHIDGDTAFDGFMFETYEDEDHYVRYETPKNKVWTLIEEEGKQYIINGLHHVNRLGHFVTWNNWDEDVKVKL